MIADDVREHRLGRFKAYPAYKDSGVEWLGEIPEHWNVARIGDTTMLVNGYPFDSEHFVRGEGVPLARIRDLEGIETEVNYAGPVVSDVWIGAGDVIIGMDGDFNVARWRGQRALLNQRMCCLRPRGETDAGFVAYALPRPLKMINDLTYSTTVKHLSSSDVRKIRTSAPPGAEQRAIASFLDQETAKIDALIAKKERLIELLEEKRVALITQAVTKGLDPNGSMKDSEVESFGRVPAHWQIQRLKVSLRGLEQGWSPLCENRQAEADEWGVLKVGCVNREEFDETENKALPSDLEPALQFEIVRGDILMSRANTRELLGSAALVKEVRARLLLCDKLYRIRVDANEVLPEFLVRVLSSRSSRFQLEREATGASGSMQNISQEMIANLILLVPPLSEQHHILGILAAASRTLRTLSNQVRDVITHLKELRSALISAAVTGKIDVREHAA